MSPIHKNSFEKVGRTEGVDSIGFIPERNEPLDRSKQSFPGESSTPVVTTVAFHSEHHGLCEEGK